MKSNGWEEEEEDEEELELEEEEVEGAAAAAPPAPASRCYWRCRCCDGRGDRVALFFLLFEEEPGAEEGRVKKERERVFCLCEFCSSFYKMRYKPEIQNEV